MVGTIEAGCSGGVSRLTTSLSYRCFLSARSLASISDFGIALNSPNLLFHESSATGDAAEFRSASGDGANGVYDHDGAVGCVVTSGGPGGTSSGPPKLGSGYEAG